MTVPTTEPARRLRRWATLLREHAANPAIYRKSLLHTIENRPGQPPQERYCAVGLMIRASYPEGTPHDEIWIQTGNDGDHIAIYSETGSELEHYPEPETVEKMGFPPESNPFALKEIGQEHPDPSLQQWSAPDLVFMPIEMFQEPDEILNLERGVAELDGQVFTLIFSASDAGQKYWPDIAAYAEQRAAQLEAQAGQPAESGHQPRP